MNVTPLTRESRDALLAAYEGLWTRYVEAMVRRPPDHDEAESARRELDALLQGYYDGLPRAVLGRCPFCQSLFRNSFDPWGPDGYWWQEKDTMHTEEPARCPHFSVLQGAVRLHPESVKGAPRNESVLGPGVPFVIPRVLEQPGVVAVVMAVPMEHGHTAYPITYYSRDSLPPHAFTQPWTRTSFSWPDEKGGFGWRIDTDPWDFELEPWVGRGKVFWIEPGDDEYRLRSAGDGTCPFVKMQGVRERQYVKGDQLWTLKPPQGEGVDPFSK